MVKRIGILTAGGDCPGLNAVIRVIVKAAIQDYGLEVIGFRDGFDGLINGDHVELRNNDVSGILTLGGTILGTSNIANPFRYPVTVNNCKRVMKDRSSEAFDTYKHNELDALIAIGGDGTLSIANRLSKMGMNIVAVPKTIDNDLSGTEVTFGFHSAVTTATEAIDKLHSTAQSHHRVMIVEVMGRYAGWIALYAGVSGGGDVILIPEIPYDLKKICKKVEERHKSGKRFSIIVVAEGAKPKGGRVTVSRIVKDSTDKIRLGGVANNLASSIEEATCIESRATILGHVQRGGSPTPYDRTLGTLFGHEALKLAAAKRFGRMAAIKGGKISNVPIGLAVAKIKTVDTRHPLVKAARAVGTSFGD